MENQVSHARAGMDVIAALRGEVAEAPAAQAVATAPVPAAVPAAKAKRNARRKPERKPERAPAPPVVRREEAPPPQAVAPAGAPAGAPVGEPERIETRQRTLSKRVTGLLLLLSATATGLATWAALTARDTTLGGIALILGALTAGLWFLRVVSVPTTVSLLGPHLEVTQAGRHYTWDLASNYSPVDHVQGRPGRPGWKVILRNPDGSTFAIDGSMVPPKRFTEILSRYRPEL